MKRTFKTILCAAAVVMASVSCQKSAEPVQPAEKGKETIDICVNGLMGEYTQVDGTKAELVNTVRVSWKGGETVYVYDGTKCLGSLKASLEGDEDRYAVLSTDGSTHKVSTPAQGTTTLTLVYSPLLTEAPAVNDGAISISLADQSGAKAPFVAYATLNYTSTTITNAVVPFKFATSVIKVNCTGLKPGTAITSATLSNVNTECKLTLSGNAAPTVSGDANGTITRTGDEYFAAAKINDEGEAVFQIAVPKLETASEARVLTVAQSSDEVKDKKFTTKSLNPATSVNTVCQLVGLPAGALEGVFTVSNDDGTTKTQIYFSQGNIYWDGSAFKFEANQYSGTSYANNHVSHFYWSKDASVAYAEEYNDGSASGSDVFFTNETETTSKDGFTVNVGGTEQTGWRTLSTAEWTYLFNNHTKKWATVNGVNGYVIAPDGFEGTLADSYADDAALAAAGNLVFLPAAGLRYGSSVITVGDGGGYWPSTALDEGTAYYVFFSSSYVEVSTFSRSYGFSVRLITEPGAPAPQVISVESVSLNKSTLELAVGSDETLTATVTPDNATDKNVSWSSSDESVATVDVSGKVTAVAAGTATITVTTTDGGKTTTCAVTVIPAGALAGEFSVSATKKVHFSKGNLTYDVEATTNKWKFYEHQYDRADNGSASTTLISLFTWGYGDWSTDPTTTTYLKGHTSDGEPFKPSEDWGSQIGDGKTWRTLTTAEWQYLFNGRDSASNLYKYGVTVCGIANCVVLLPDGWTWDASTVGTGWQTNYPSTSDDKVTWQKMEEAGAVCLPAAGYRLGSNVSTVGDSGRYWSSTADGSNNAYRVLFNSNDVSPDSNGGRNLGFVVRLITESN